MKGIEFLGFIALNIGLILMLASGFTKNRWFFSDRLLAGLVAWAWLIVALEISLGYLGLLYREILLSWLSSFGIVLFILRYHSSIRFLRDLWRGAWKFWHDLSWPDRLPWLLMGIGGVWTALLIVWLPTLDWDGQWYHLPKVFSRLQWGDLRPIPGYWPYFITGLMEIGELLILWPVMAFRHAWVSDGGSWLFWWVGILAIYAIGRKAKLSPRALGWGALIWAFAPVVWLQARTAHVDLMVAGLFLAGLNFALDCSGSRQGSALVAMVAGLVGGIKQGAVIYGMILALLWVGGIVAQRRPKVIERQSLLGMIGLWLLFSAPGWIQYLDRWIRYGNPLWPVELTIAGRVIFQGPLALAWQEGNMHTPTLIRGLPKWLQWWPIWLELDNRYFYASSANGFGPQWWILGLPGIVFWLLRPGQSQRLVLVGVSLLILLISPWSWHTRYVMFLAAIGSLGVAEVLSSGRLCTKILIRVLILVSVGYVIALSMDSPAWLGEIRRQALLPPEWRRATFVGAMEGAFRWLDQNARGSARVGYGDSLGLIGMLWGEDLRHQVTYVKVQEVSPQVIDFLVAPVDSSQDQAAAHHPQCVQIVEDLRDIKTLSVHLYWCGVRRSQ